MKEVHMLLCVKSQSIQRRWVDNDNWLVSLMQGQVIITQNWLAHSKQSWVTFVQCTVSPWKSLPQKMDADGVHGFRKDLYEFMKEMSKSVRHMNPYFTKCLSCSVAGTVFWENIIMCYCPVMTMPKHPPLVW